MFRLASLVEEHAETLATVETWDNGKPYNVALNEDVGEVVNTLRYYGGYADKVQYVFSASTYSLLNQSVTDETRLGNVCSIDIFQGLKHPLR